jgi:hypothetical protein
LPAILEADTTTLSGALRVLLAQLKLELDQLALRVDEADAILNLGESFFPTLMCGNCNAR